MSRIIEITDFNEPELDAYARLSEVQLLRWNHPEQGMFIAESPKVIERALDSGYEPVSFLVEKRQIEGEAKEILERCPKIPVYTAQFDVLTQLTGFKLTRGMLCLMHRKPLLDLRMVCEGKRRIVVLENVMNPTNVGAIFRSAAALNMDAVLLTSGCSNPLYRRSIRVSMGTVFQVPWTFVPEDWQKQLRGLEYETAAMALTDESISLRDPVLSKVEKLAIVMGTEGEGLDRETISDCDYTIKIPMSHGVDSLNVAAASAVAFWQLGNIE